ncbi:MFS transporter [Psychrobacillus lasiicapitis]|uniref:MFS transporter n=1 Tax=Psychrobacillus lasiicapitis TaxID=1636719 RepID=UPI00198A7059|nr:MFS transporter [Psychrobacillus lasiicapitis]GGA48879.1 permease [Psychrobacillus lasiicapitis]
MKSNRNFLYLLVGQSLANIGDVLYIVGVISIIYSLTESATASAFVPFTITFSMFVSSVLTPLLIDKFNLKHLLVDSQIGKTIFLFGLGIHLMIGFDANKLIFIFVVIYLIAFLDGCANPIRQTLIPNYVAEDSLVKANGVAETVTQSIQIGTSFFGSMLLVVFDPNELIWLVTMLFVFSSIILGLLKNVEHKEETDEKKWTQLTKGWKTIKRTPLLKTVVRMDIVETIAGSVWIAAIILVYVEQALKAQEYWWGFINAAFFIGLVLGSLLCIKFSLFVDKKRHVFIIIGASLTSIFTVVFGLTSLPVIAVILSALIGIFGQLKNIPQQTLVQKSVPKEQLATVYTSLGTLGTGTFGIAALVMGVLSDYLGVRSIFVFFGYFTCTS